MCYEMIGAGISAISSVATSNAQAKAYNTQAQIARNNAARAENAALNVSKSGAYQEAAIMRQGRQTIGTQQAAYNASNIDTTSGSAADVMSTSDYNSVKDALNVRREAANQSYNYEENAMDYKNQANSYDSAAKNAKTAGLLSAGTAIIGGITSSNANAAKANALTGTSSGVSSNYFNTASSALTTPTYSDFSNLSSIADNTLSDDNSAFSLLTGTTSKKYKRWY